VRLYAEYLFSLRIRQNVAADGAFGCPGIGVFASSTPTPHEILAQEIILEVEFLVTTRRTRSTISWEVFGRPVLGLSSTW
jgi:hypothetical protein